jgi:peptidoglycan/xylan/chitin deacetylase (PgdA/CDA1 family)
MTRGVVWLVAACLTPVWPCVEAFQQDTSSAVLTGRLLSDDGQPVDRAVVPILRATDPASGRPRSATALGCSLVCLAFVTGSVVARSQEPTRSRAMALTFDDLPFVPAGEAYFPAATRATSELLRVLRQHRAPAIGFVNEGQLEAGGERQRAREAVLQQWIDAGMTLGNHTYAHRDVNTQTIDEFQADIIRGEPTIKRLMTGRTSQQLFFRHPMTHTGDTKEKKDAIDAFLSARGYRIAPHTIENSDFIFNVVYVRAQAARDRALAGRVRDAYVDLTMAATAFAEKTAQAIFARDIPQTLLLHANVLTAESLETLLSRFEARGYRFITLEEAVADPAYATPDTLVSAHGPTWLWRWARTLGVRVSAEGDPEVPAWVLDAYRR